MKFGWKKDPYNNKDFKFSQLKPRLASLSNSTEYIIPETTPVYDQLSLQSCVANATANALEILINLKDKKIISLSRLFVYWNARVYTKETDKDEGTYIRNAFDSLRKLGVCLESVCNYDSNRVFAQPTLDAYRQGDDNTLTSFYRINSSDKQRIEDIETAIRANHPVVFGTAVSKEFQNYNGNTKVWSPPDSYIGYHAMLVVGVRTSDSGRKEFLIKNSWGKYWGDNGKTWFDESYLSWGETDDLWVPTMMPDLTI